MQAVSWDIQSTHFTCFQSLRDHCPSLADVQCLECYCFIYFVWCFRVYLILVTPSVTKAEVLLTCYPIAIFINDCHVNQLFHWSLVIFKKSSIFSLLTSIHQKKSFPPSPGDESQFLLLGQNYCLTLFIQNKELLIVTSILVNEFPHFFPVLFLHFV